MTKKTKKKIVWTNIGWYLFLVLCALSLSMFIYSTVRVCMYAGGKSTANLNNVMQMVFSIVCILVLSVYVSVIKVAKLKSSYTIGMFFMAVLFLIFGVYPCFNLYQSKIAVSVLFAILGLAFSVAAISVYFYFSKEQNGTVKALPLFLISFIVLFETFFVLLFGILLYLLTKSSNYEIFTLSNFLENIAYSWIGLFVICGLCYVSLIRDKKFLNLCLVTRISD